MSGVTGRIAKVAFAKFAANSWGVAASVTKGVHWTSDGGMTPRPAYIEDRSMNQNFLRAAEVGDFAPADVAFTGQARYEDHNYILEACLFGSPAAVTISTSAVGQVTSWKHILDLAPSIDGLGVTIAIDKSLFVDELTSAKVQGLSERVGTGGVIEQTFRFLGSRPTNTSSVNINSTVGGASYPAFGQRVFRNQGVFRLNAQAGAALDATFVQTVETFDLDISRPQDPRMVFGQTYTIEPADQGFPDITFRVTFPRMNTVSANSLYGYLTSGSALKADLTYSGAYINSTDRYSRLYQFPYVELQEWAASLVEANQVSPTALFRCKEATAAPTGMTGVTKPVRLTRILVNSVVAF